MDSIAQWTKALVCSPKDLLFLAPPRSYHPHWSQCQSRSVHPSIRDQNLFCCISFQVSHSVQLAAFHQEHRSSDGRVFSLISLRLMSVHQSPSKSFPVNDSQCLVFWWAKSLFKVFSLIRFKVSLIQSSKCPIMPAGT